MVNTTTYHKTNMAVLQFTKLHVLINNELKKTKRAKRNLIHALFSSQQSERYPTKYCQQQFTNNMHKNKCM